MTSKPGLKALTRFNAVNRDSLTIDYEVYGEGESKLAWLDKNITINTDHDDAVFVTQKLIGSIVDQIQAQRISIGHLKFFIESPHSKQKVSITTTTTWQGFQTSIIANESCKLTDQRPRRDRTFPVGEVSGWGVVKCAACLPMQNRSGQLVCIQTWISPSDLSNDLTSLISF